jgi:adenosylmethionine-8-amino-7-oxononanoate aminotransferase
VGLACSECFSGPNLYKVLKPGMDFEQQVMDSLLLQSPIGSSSSSSSSGEENIYAPPLSIHTSAGLPDALETFLNALEPHLPWKKNADSPNDWTCSLQLEGASAVWAAIDMCLQVSMIEQPEKNKDRLMVAVGKTSYHGPPSTSFGGSSPLWQKQYQIQYPTPVAGEVINESELYADFTTFLDTYGDQIGVILIEPQWGSSQAALPWPKSLVQKYIKLSQSRGIKVVCDEIMCGLGRHGHGTFFASEAWDLNPDAITFGKAIAGGCFQLSGAVLKTGRDLLASKGKSVMQSHTYAGSSTRALMTATEVLKELPKWYPTISQLGVELGNVLQGVEDVSDGMIMCHGQGLMWGGLFRRNNMLSDPKFRNSAIQVFQKHCNTVGILPYHVPCGGFMLSPVLDINVDTIYEIGERLKQAVILTKEEVGWVVDHASTNIEDKTLTPRTVTEIVV